VAVDAQSVASEKVCIGDRLLVIGKHSIRQHLHLVPDQMSEDAVPRSGPAVIDARRLDAAFASIINASTTQGRLRLHLLLWRADSGSHENGARKS
jgi:hypothetical protein